METTFWGNLTSVETAAVTAVPGMFAPASDGRNSGPAVWFGDAEGDGDGLIIQAESAEDLAGALRRLADKVEAAPAPEPLALCRWCGGRIQGGLRNAYAYTYWHVDVDEEDEHVENDERCPDEAHCADPVTVEVPWRQARGRVCRVERGDDVLFGIAEAEPFSGRAQIAVPYAGMAFTRLATVSLVAAADDLAAEQTYQMGPVTVTVTDGAVTKAVVGVDASTMHDAMGDEDASQEDRDAVHAWLSTLASTQWPLPTGDQ